MRLPGVRGGREAGGKADADPSPTTDPGAAPQEKRGKKRRGGKRQRNRSQPLQGLESMLAPGRDRQVVILAHASQREAVQPWLAEFARDRVCVISAEEAPEWGLKENDRVVRRTAANLDKLVNQVKLVGAVDIMVSLLPTGLLPDGRRRPPGPLRATVPLRHEGGRLRGGPAAGIRVADGRPRQRLQVLDAADGHGDRSGLSWLDRDSPGRSGPTRCLVDLVVVTKRLRHFVKLLDSQVDRILPAREPSCLATSLARRPGGEFESQAQVVSHQSSLTDETLPSLIGCPAAPASLRGPDRPGRADPDVHRAQHPSRLVSLAPQRQPGQPAAPGQPRQFARMDSAHLPRRKLAGRFYQPTAPSPTTSAT